MTSRQPNEDRELRMLLQALSGRDVRVLDPKNTKM